MVVTTDQAEAVCVYQVRAGDYCIKIQEEFGVYSLNRFYNMNPGIHHNCDNLRIGQIVYVRKDQDCGTECNSNKCWSMSPCKYTELVCHCMLVF